MSTMHTSRLLKLPRAAILGLAMVSVVIAAAVAGGCVREVVSGYDPEDKSGQLNSKSATNRLVVLVPWMQPPTPRLLLDDKLARCETVFSRNPDGVVRYVLRTVVGQTSTVEVRTKRLPDDAMEFTYEIKSLPPKYSLDVPFEVTAADSRPAIDLLMNGTPVNVVPGTDVVVLQLARDAVTKIRAIPKAPPPEAAGSTAVPAASATPAAAAGASVKQPPATAPRP
jgi:hypothetical protein